MNTEPKIEEAAPPAPVPVLLLAILNRLSTLPRRGGIHAGTYLVLRRIAGGQPWTSTQLADELHVQPPSISAILKYCRQSRLIKQALDPNDGRRRITTLTPKGEDVYRTAELEFSITIEAITQSIPKEALDTFISVFGKLENAITKLY